MLNTNIGALISRLQTEGLVALGQMPEIDTNEWGVRQMEREYACLNGSYPVLEPAFGTAPVNPPDMDLSFLGKHSARFTRNSFARGIGKLSLLYKGAVFASDDDDAITDVFPQSSAAQRETTSLVVYTYDGTAHNWGLPATVVNLNYLALNLHFQYVARSRPLLPRFITLSQTRGFTAAAATDTLTLTGGAVLPNGTRVRLMVKGTSGYGGGVLPAGLAADVAYYVVNANAGAGTVQLSLTPGGSVVNITDAGSDGTFSLTSYYASDADHPAPVVDSASAIVTAGSTTLEVPPPAAYLDFLEYFTVLSEFNSVPCGNYWEVTETGLVKITGWVPTPLADFA